MADYENILFRLQKAEESIKELYSKVNGFSVSQAEANTKLDNMLVTLGELKQSVASLSARPAKAWERLTSALIGAVTTGIIGFVIAKIF